MVGEMPRMDLPGLVDLREDRGAPIVADSKEKRDEMIKEVGSGMKMSDGSMLYYIDDFMLISPTGDIKLLLCWNLITQGGKRSVEPIRYIHVDKGVGEVERQRLNI